MSVSEVHDEHIFLFVLVYEKVFRTQYVGWIVMGIKINALDSCTDFAVYTFFPLGRVMLDNGYHQSSVICVLLSP
jgi:hypothetical protein